MEVNILAHDKAMLYPKGWDDERRKKDAVTTLQVCCICGLTHVSPSDSVLKPHLHFHTSKVYMHEFEEVSLPENAREALGMDKAIFCFESTICLEHLFSDHIRMWSVLHKLYSKEVAKGNPHLTNALNVGGALPDVYSKSVRFTNQMNVMALNYRWRKTFLEGVMAELKKGG